MKSFDLALPQEMAQAVESFLTFYNPGAKQRKLTWIYAQGECSVKSQFGGKTYDILMTPVQAAVLALFNDAESLSYADIRGKLGGVGAVSSSRCSCVCVLGEGPAARAPASRVWDAPVWPPCLAPKPFFPLPPSPAAGAGGRQASGGPAVLALQHEVQAADQAAGGEEDRALGHLCRERLVLGQDAEDQVSAFAAGPGKPRAASGLGGCRVCLPYRRSREPLSPLRLVMPVMEDRRKVREEVETDRKHVVDAAIVRIMKARKAASHNNLTMEVMQQVKLFKPDIKLIKKCIERLIEQEYLERDENNNSILKYLA